MARINFILPFLPTKPVGGAKNMYEFANRLAAKGHSITLIHSIKRPFKKQTTPTWLRLILTRLKIKKLGWFKIAPEIDIRIVPEINDKYIPDAEATLSTWWEMAYAISDLGESKGKKNNFIQDYEVWTGQEEKVHQSYSLPIHHIVIARYLRDLVYRFSGIQPILVNTPIDTRKFALINTIENRFPHSIMMMYSKEPRKGSEYGLRALIQLKKELPDLNVSLFSVYERSAEIPEWIKYYHRPTDLTKLYNDHTVFFSPSLGEGWGLPPAEAMACGCAIVCTDIGGHHDYAMDNITALLVEPKNVVEMTEKLKLILTDSNLRIRISTAGYQNLIREFSWDSAVDQMELHLLSKEK